jgi:flagellum-specific ATP synthase
LMAAHSALAQLKQIETVRYCGKLLRIMPTWLEASGPNSPIGSICRVLPLEGPAVLAEIIRIDSDSVALVPFSDVRNLSVGSRVEALPGATRLPVGMSFLGRAVDALGHPIDGGEPIWDHSWSPLNPDPPAPLERETPNEILETGIALIDGLLPLGRGQRIGIFAASGVGKTSLVSQLLRQVDADVCVCCLVGERGREVEAIWSRELGGKTRMRSVLVAATSDQAAALRVRAVYQAIALARFYRDSGLHVFFVLDSVTRFAMALRELGLAAGEPPTVRAYTPSVFSTIPRIVEQGGALKSGGSISAVMTILAETDDVDDPLSELMKSLLDGHLILSRSMAERGQFPAIDPLKSVSRNATALMNSAHSPLSRRAHTLLARYESTRTLIDAGLYNSGTNSEIDAAIIAEPRLADFMRQRLDQSCTLQETLASLTSALDS